MSTMRVMASSGSIVRELAALISKFLKDNGGMSNGYNTWVKIKGDKISWRTPKRVDMTERQADKLGEKLHEKMRAIMKENDHEEWKLRVGAEHVEWGCHRMIVSITPPSVSTGVMLLN